MPQLYSKNMRINHKGVNQKLYSHPKYMVSITECSQPKGIKPKMKEAN
jgi:hypothetical protein